jgi:predicted nucleic acid-binding protein
MTDQVIDASALVAYLWGEPGKEVVAALLSDLSNRCFVHSINLCEVYYQVLRRSDEAMARKAIVGLRADGVLERSDMDEPFWEKVASLKSRGRISIADCFCLGLAIEIGCQVVTSDHKEFDPLVPLGLCPILFIR